jgi:hypothetical protein
MVGISITDCNTGNSVNVKGTLVPVSADNLGAHGLFGFKESFSQNCICRVCYATFDETQHLFREADFRLRNSVDHAKDVEKSKQDADAIKATGVKRDCILNELEYFNVVNNYCLDAMHDILEGIFPLELKAVLHHFVHDKKLFTVGKLNSRLKNFT